MEPSASPSSARRVLLLLVVLAGALMALSMVQRDRALEQGYEDARRRAELYAGTVIRSSLTSEDVVAPLDEEARTALLAEIQGFVLTDPAVARVRLWGSDGTLLFSTDPADGSGDTVEDASIERAADGQVVSRLAAERLSPPATEEGGPQVTPLFQTFSPLRVAGTSEVGGATEVEQFAAQIEEAADDPWWVVQVAASGITVMLALLAFVSVARGARRRTAPRTREPEVRPARRKRGRGSGWDDADAAELQQRLDRATTRAEEAEEAAKSFATRLRELTARLEQVERQSPDERVDELREALRRSEAERAMLRSGRPETRAEAELRELRHRVHEAETLAVAAEAVVAGGGDLAPVKEQLALAARQVDEAVERAAVAEGRADAAEDRARAAGDMATAAEGRIDVLEAKLRELAGAGVPAAEITEIDEIRAQLADADRRVAEAQARASDLETRLAAAGSLDGQGEELLLALEARLVAAEARAAESEAKMRTFEDASVEEGGSFRHRLGVTAAGRKLAAPPPPTEEDLPDPEIDLRAAIARGLRAPLTRASGLTLALQGSIESGEGRASLRQLSTSLRRVDQLAADLYDVQRIIDGTLPLDRKRTDLAALVATTVDEAVHLEDRVVRFDADTVHARVDPARARQIVDGMLEAARERTRTGAAIVVQVRDTSAGARVTVQDDNATPARIGPELALAVRLAELLGTELTIDGSTFRVVFPKVEV
jgi:hypothetical protein